MNSRPKPIVPTADYKLSDGITPEQWMELYRQCRAEVERKARTGLCDVRVKGS